MSVEVRPLSHALGGEVLGVRIGGNLPDGVVEDLRNAFLKHQVLLFRDQEISHEEHMAFSRYFGDLDPHESVPDLRLKSHPHILEVTNAGRKPSHVFGRQWHADHTMTSHPSRASLLRSKQLPDVGGDTMFANMYMAFETLSEGLRNLMRSLHGVHTVTAARHLQGVDPEVLAAKSQRNPPVAHPAVKVHPGTGREALYVNEMLTSHFHGWTYEESRPLLEFLYRHAARPEFVYRHTWRPHDLVMWDNFCTQHVALADYDHSQLRLLYRTTVIGPESGFLVQ